MDPALYRPSAGEIPCKPGVYRFFDDRNVVIYVGKAKNLRSRLNSYFADPAALHPRTHQMVHAACRVAWTVVANEVEALQLEYTWIKEHNPRFNVKYRDDKSYPYLAVTLYEEYPRVQVLRGDKRKGVRYFGPYSHAWAIRETVDLLLRVYPVRTCSRGVFRRAEQSGRPCLLGYIEKCSAPCVGRVTAAEHRAHALGLCDFMAGNTRHVVDTLRTAMMTASEAQDYETAARRRDDIGALDRVLEKNTVVLPDATDADVLALVADDIDASVYGFHVRAGRVRGQRGWVTERDADDDEATLMQRLLIHLYGEVDATAVPKEILVSTAPAELRATAAWLAERRGAAVDLRVPQRGEKKTLLDTVSENATQALKLHKSRRSSDLNARSAAMTDLQSTLGMDSAPLRIECFDVSTLHGTHTVGSMVVFEDGLPRKSDYRRFTVSAANAGSDVAAMREVLSRRFARYLAEASERDGVDVDVQSETDDAVPGRTSSFAYPPHLVVVDGGPPQVSVAASVMEELGMSDVFVCGLAKRLEEVWIPREDYPVVFSRGSAALYLLQHVRDEAHRFAISHHRSKRSKAMTQSALDGVRGLGPKRIKALLAEFGSTAAIRAAGPEKVAAVKGIGARIAADVISHLEKQDTGPAVNVTTGEVVDGGG